MKHTVTLIPGDGVGPEVIEAARRCLEATGVQFQWDVIPAGESALEKEGSLLPERLLESIRKNRVALKGPTTTPVGTGFRSVNVALRQTLDLYACLRPCHSYAGIPARYENVDIVVVRENTEDLYAGIEFARGAAETKKLLAFIGQYAAEKVPADSGISIKLISETGSRRIVKFAFDYARANGRKKVSAIHKANIMKFTDGLFLDVAREVARSYSDIEFEDRIVDELCTHLVQRPHEFDVLVLPNLYGDIVSDLCAGLVGGLGVAPGANIGDKLAVFEPTHG
ncbi:MAG: isocitrate/isopropylmalate dehydrogenase family protein, partial [Chloroflexi bacterium]|nr:isocitrate/isopropylmalate dehydrogenase family protein [Chloroflexota bacterium]